MPISYNIDRTQRKLSTIVVGRVTVDEILGHLEAVQKENALSYPELIDANGAERPSLSATDVWKAASAVRNRSLPKEIGPRAVIVHDDLQYGLTRIFTNIVSGHFPIEAFRDQEKAEAWLAEWSRPPGTE